MGQGDLNPTEVVAALIDLGESFEDGIHLAQQAIEGSCSFLILTRDGIYAARDRFGRTPVVIGRKDGAAAVALESCAFPNLRYEVVKELGPGEIVFMTADGWEQRVKPGDKLQICGFLWVYYGYPASTYEGINVETVRYRCGAALARRFPAQIDFVSGIPDSGIGHALGYSAESGVPFQRPFVKYNPTWARSFMPHSQEVRDLVARMKLIPVRELVKGRRILFCEDSIVRGTQLKDTIQRLYEVGAREIHMRPACPPLVFGCKFLNFSRSRSEMDLAARQAIRELEGHDLGDPSDYTRADSEKYHAAQDWIRRRLNLTTLRYQLMDDLIASIGLPKKKTCTYCWDGVDGTL
jgi:amidophosphoribosyltransferase